MSEQKLRFEKPADNAVYVMVFRDDRRLADLILSLNGRHYFMGYYSASDLRVIADKIDELDKAAASQE